MDVFGVFFILSSLPRSRFASAVFDFNTSFSEAVPVSPILLPVDINICEKSELLMDVFCVSSFFCLHHLD